MFSNLRKASGSDVGGHDGGPGGRHSTSLRELGALLRERREAMGVSLAEVEVATRIRQKYLSALESDEWHLLPGEVVGRGFLRNYADYLGLEPNEAIDRRRAVSDIALGQVLANTSGGSSLPPIREVDYRPKEVDLKDEGDGIQRGEIRLTPLFAIVGVALLVLVAWWGISAMAGPMGAFFSEIPERIAGVVERPTPTPTLDVPAVVSADVPGDASGEVAGVVNPDNLALTEAAQLAAEANAQNVPAGQPPVAATPIVQAPSQPEPAPEPLSGTGGPVDEAAPTGETDAGTVAGDNPPASAPSTSGLILVPTNTPAPQDAGQQPAPTPEPPTPVPPMPDPPTPTPPDPVQEAPAVVAEPEPPAVVEPPTATPEPAVEQAPVVAPACGDPRSVISGPGVNQVLSGVAGVTGVATHQEFQYFKLEYAPGANAGGGFVYFSGSSTPVEGGLLGNLDTRALPNGDYTIRLTVVDQTSNYPPPCDVSIVIQN